MIQLENVSVTVGQRTQRKCLLNQISLQVKAGEKLAILGANGAGKSTLLKCLSGEHTHYDGSILLGSKELQQWAAAARAKQLAVMPQKVELAFPFRVDQVVALGRSPYGDEHNCHALLQEVMGCLDVWHLRERSYPGLSGGEQQRVQLARVLAQIWHPILNGQHQPQPRVLLLDECTSALDPSHQHEVMQTVDNFAQQDVAVIAVMHDISLAASWADRVLFLKHGEMLAYGDAECLTNADLLAEAYDMEPALAQRYVAQNKVWRES